MADADLEIGLQWDRDLKAFRVSNRFEIIGDGVDQWQALEDPLSINVEQLRKLTMHEPDYAHALTQMVFGCSALKSFYLEARDQTKGRYRLHMRLHISGTAPAAYHALRWESLRDPNTQTPIAMGPDVFLSRYLSSPYWRPVPAPDMHELQALIVVAAPSDLGSYRPEGRELAEVDVEEELARARYALTKIPHVKQPVAATLSDIMSELERGVDVLYLVCHGRLIDDVPQLFLEKPDGTADVVDGRRLVERLLELEQRPMVVFLCSCQSASAGTQMWNTDSGELSALGPRLASAGVGAVVAMQGNLSMETGRIFAPAFFTELAKHGVVDEAMARARREIGEQRDWWMPVLYSRLRSGRTYYASGFAGHADTTWTSLGAQVRAGYFTPVLGPLLASGIVGSRQDIARAWARRWQMQIAPHNQGDLAVVAQYLSLRHNPGLVRTWLQEHFMDQIRERKIRADKIRERKRRADEIRGRKSLADPNDLIWDLPEARLNDTDPEPAFREVGHRLRMVDETDPYRILAGLRASVYVTTGWTDLLEDALSEAGRIPNRIMFPWNDQIEIKDSEPPTVEHPIVYHLFGHLDDLSSLVLAEDDYFAWLDAWSTRRRDVPSYIRKALTARSLIFLGYRLDDWDFRVLFESIKNFGGSQLIRQNQHVAVQLSRESQSIEPEAVQQYLEWRLGEVKVSIYWGSTQQFLKELQARMTP